MDQVSKLIRADGIHRTSIPYGTIKGAIKRRVEQFMVKSSLLYQLNLLGVKYSHDRKYLDFDKASSTVLVRCTQRELRISSPLEVGKCQRALQYGTPCKGIGSLTHAYRGRGRLGKTLNTY